MTTIEWTRGDDGSRGETWNPTTGCDRVSPGCDNALGSDETTEPVPLGVVARDVAAWPAFIVKSSERPVAAAFAAYDWVRLPSLAKIIPDSVPCHVCTHRLDHLQVLRAVVELVPVDVVDDLAATKRPTGCLAGNQAVFIDVSPRVGHRVTRTLDEYVAARCDGATTPPVRVSAGGLAFRHTESVASRMEQGQ